MSYVFNDIVYVPFSKILGQGKLFLEASLEAFCVCDFRCTSLFCFQVFRPPHRSCGIYTVVFVRQGPLQFLVRCVIQLYPRMAKLGEGDKRWIVEERPDGANVHNWHWAEKDCLPWSKKRLGELLENIPVLEGEGNLWIQTTTLESVTGEAYVNIRYLKV